MRMTHTEWAEMTRETSFTLNDLECTYLCICIIMSAIVKAVQRQAQTQLLEKLDRSASTLYADQ